MTSGGEYQVHLILGDSMYSRIRTEKVFKGNPGGPIVEETTFGWVVHGGDEYASDGACMYLREVNDYEKLYSLNVLGVEDQGENDQFDVLQDFKENIARRSDGRYEVSFPWIPGAELSSTNKALSRKRLQNNERRLSENESLRGQYADIIEEQLRVSQNFPLAIERYSAHAGSTIEDCILSYKSDFILHNSTLHVPFYDQSQSN